MQQKFTRKNLGFLFKRFFAMALVFVSLTNVSNSQVLINEGFDVVTPAGWSQQNLSTPAGINPVWFQGNAAVFPAQSGATTSYAAANFQCVAGANTISMWLFAPNITLKNGDIFTFWSRTVPFPAFPDRLQVRMSTNGASTDAGTTPTSVGDFTNLLLDINPLYSTSGYPNVWTEYSITISGLAGPTSGRIAFRYFVEDGGPAGNNSDYIGVDNVVYTAFTGPCSGTPVPGSTVATPASICPGINFVLTLPATPFQSGLTFQWQSSPDGVAWTNIAGATSRSLTTNQAVATYYRANVTCSGNTAPSSTLLVPMNAPFACYCSSSATSTADEDIFNVTVGTLNNSSTCASVGPGALSVQNLYSNYTSGAGAPAAPEVFRGANNNISVTIGTCGGAFTNSVAVWIDVNQDGQFTAAERVYVSPAGTVGPHTETGLMNVPITALLGVTRMRVVNVETGAPTTIPACGTYTWGETEDYNVNIVNCVQGTITTQPASATTSCGSNASFTVAGTGSLLSWRWQQRVNASAVWTDVVNGGVFSGATTATLTLTNVPSTMNGYQYRALMTGACTAIDFSSPATLTVTPLIATVNPTSATICVGSIQQLTLTNASSPATVTFTNSTPLPIPDNVFTGVISTIAVSGIPAGAIVTNVSVTLNISHTWVGDLDINVIAPNNVNMNLVGALDGGTGSNGTDNFIGTIISSTSTNPISGAPAPRTGTFAAEKRVGYGPTGNTQTAVTDWPALLGTLNGNWRLAVADFAGLDVGTINSWSVSITFGAPAAGTWTGPAGTIFTDAPATVPYVAGTPVTSVYVKPTTTSTYSVVYNTLTPCTSAPTNIVVNVSSPAVGLAVTPLTRSVCVGGSTTFSATTTGGGPFTWQWQSSPDGTTWTNVAGATGATLNLTGVTQAMSGLRYRVIATAAPCAGSVTSTIVGQLTVNPLPAITIAAGDVSLVPGQTTTVTATPSPAGATWVWRRNGALIGGANNNTRAATVDSIGTYQVTVTDGNGCVGTSNSLVIGTEASDRLWIYPNPSSGVFQVRLFYRIGNVINDKRVVSVYTSNGDLVARKEFALDNVTNPYLKMEFDLSRSAPGTYVVKVADRFSGQIVSGLLVIAR